MGLGVSAKLFGKLESYTFLIFFFFWPLVVSFMFALILSTKKG